MGKLKITKDILEALMPLAKRPSIEVEELTRELQEKLPYRLLLEGDVADVIDRCSSFGDFSQDLRSSLVDVVSGVHNLVQSVDLPVTELLQEIRSSYEADTSFAMDDVTFEVLRKNFLSILNVRQVYASVKGLNLLGESDRLYIRSKIVTDVRPVFDEDLGNPIAAAVVLHTLKLSVRKNGVNENIYVTLDSMDLLDLKGLVERAIKKAEVINKAFHPDLGNSAFGKLLDLDGDDE